MNNRLTHRVSLTNRPAFEALEERQLCSTTAAGTAALTTAAIAKRLQTEASFAGVNGAILATAIKTASSGKARDAAQAERIIIAAGLGLPAEALATNLSAKQLVEQTANLGIVGASTKATTPDYWKTVKAKGADFALAGAVRASLALPEDATKGKSPKQLLQDAANISLLTGDPSSPKAWAGLSLLKQGKITVEQYAARYADGADLSVAAKALGQKFARARVARAAAAKTKQTNTGSSTPNGYNPRTDVPTDKNYGSSGIPYAQPSATTNQAPAGTGTDGTTAEYTVNGVTHNSDGTTAVSWTQTVGGQSTNYTTTYYPADDAGPAYYSVTDSTGQLVDGGNGTPPKDSVAGTTTQSTNGDQAIFPDDGTDSNTGSKDGGKKDDTGNATNNDKDGDGIPDDQDPTDDRDKDGDGKPDDQTPATTDTSGTTPADDTTPAATEPAKSGTPTPDGGGPSAKAREQWLTSTPFGQAEMRSVISVLGLTHSGGFGDPTDPGINQHARFAFYTSSLFANQPLTIDNNPGNIDYVGDIKPSAVLDARQIQAIAIKSGGAVGGPDAGKKPVGTGGLDNPVIPKVPLVGGGTTSMVFSTTAITAKVVRIASSALTAKVAASAAAVVARK